MKVVFIFNQTVQLLNVRSLEITQLPDLPRDCGNACAVGCHNKLFVIANRSTGFRGGVISEILCLRLDVDGDTWRVVGNTRESHSVSKALYDKDLDRIFVSGGSRGCSASFLGTSTASVEWFDPRPEQSVCMYDARMSKDRWNYSFLKHRDMLVCAGLDNTVEYKSVGRSNWSPGVYLDIGAQIKAVVSCGELYAFDGEGWLHMLHPISGKWEKLTMVDTNVVASFADDENIHALIWTGAGWDLWTYHSKTREQKKQHVPESNTLGRYFAGIIYEEND